jgi:hypothetical protein
MQSVDRLLHERPALSDAPIDLLRHNSEALATKTDRLLLPLFRQKRGHCQLVSSVQRNGLSDYPHIALEMVEPGVHIV